MSDDDNHIEPTPPRADDLAVHVDEHRRHLPHRPEERVAVERVRLAQDDADGRLVASSSVDSKGVKFPRAVLRPLADRSYASELWFEQAMREGRAGVDHHLNELLPPRNQAPGPHPENFAVGLAVRVDDDGMMMTLQIECNEGNNEALWNEMLCG